MFNFYMYKSTSLMLKTVQNSLKKTVYTINVSICGN